MKIPTGVAVAAAVLSCQSPAPRASVTTGRGAVRDTSTVTVTRASVAAATVNYDGKEVHAGPGHRYVLLDCRFDVAADSVDFEDFQLVRDRAVLGHETNVGDNGDNDYFYWTYVDPSGRTTALPPEPAGPFTARLAFKVPADASRGYLFYWGLYWGPFDFR